MEDWNASSCGRWALECVAPTRSGSNSRCEYSTSPVCWSPYLPPSPPIRCSMRIEVIREWAAVQAIILGVVVYVGLCAVRAAFKVLSEDKNAGKWSPNGQFTFADPPRVFFSTLPKRIIFAPSSLRWWMPSLAGYVELRIETDGFERFVRTVVMPSGIDREMIEFRLHSAQLSTSPTPL